LNFFRALFSQLFKLYAKMHYPESELELFLCANCT